MSGVEITKIQSQMLLVCGLCEERLTLKLAQKPLRPALSKSEFIKILKTAQIFSKQPRAIYRNLQALEDKGLVHYQFQELMLTPRGWKVYRSLKAQALPYLRILEASDKLISSKFKTALLSV